MKLINELNEENIGKLNNFSSLTILVSNHEMLVFKESDKDNLLSKMKLQLISFAISLKYFYRR